VALNASKKGSDTFFSIPGFRERLSFDWRLTEKGERQAIASGEWLQEEFPLGFHRYYVSDFRRARETAGLLNLPKANWWPNIYLYEQLFGPLDVVPRSELAKVSPGAHDQRNRHRFYGQYPDGERMSDVCLRLDRILETLGRECSGQRVVMVCHGNVIWGYRILIQRIEPTDFHDLDTSNDDRHRIYNGQIVHYTRRNPFTDEITSSFSWSREFVPSDPTLHDGGWRKIVRP
jgi:NAD+ kinase